MALYLGTGEKVKIYLDNNVYKVNVFSPGVVSAFAILSNDGDMVFYNREVDIPAAGSTFDGHVVSKVYVGVESTTLGIPTPLLLPEETVES